VKHNTTEGSENKSPIQSADDDIAAENEESVEGLGMIFLKYAFVVRLHTFCCVVLSLRPLKHNF
jgi:hypothetical protein